MRQNNKKIPHLAWLVAGISFLWLLLAACGENPSPTTAPLIAPPVPSASATIVPTPNPPVSVTVTFPSNSGVNTNNPAPTASIPSLVLVGELSFNPATAPPSSDPTTYPQLKYATQTGGNSPSKTIRLHLDAAGFQKLKSDNGIPGQMRRVLVAGQKGAANASNEEVMQVSFLEALGDKTKHEVGTLKYQMGSAPQLLFIPEAAKDTTPWHLLINSALQSQMGDPTTLDGKRVLLDTEKLQSRADTYYVSLLDLLGKGPTMTLKGDLAVYIADGPGPAMYIGANTSGYSLHDLASDQTYYLVVADGLAFNPAMAGPFSVTGEKLGFLDGRTHYGLFFISSIGF